MGFSPHVWFCACKSATLAYELLVSIGPSTHLWFLHAKQRLLDQHTGLYGYQTSPVVLCIQNSVPEILVSIGSSPHRWFCTLKTASLGPKLHVSIGPSPHLWFCAFKTATLWPQLHVSMGPRPQQWFPACETVRLQSEILGSMGPSPNLFSLHSKQQLLDPNNKSQLVPDITCRFVHAIQCD